MKPLGEHETSETEILRLADVGALTVFGKSLSALAEFGDSIDVPLTGDDLAAFAVVGKAAEDAKVGPR